MRITGLLFLILINEALAGGGGGKHHVHFKIHVPDIIKHHIHTKTVFIHVHAGHGGHGGGKKKKVVPKKKETHHEENHHEDWSSWSSYDIHDGHEKGHDHKHHGTKTVKTSGKGPIHGMMPHPHGHVGHLTLGDHGQGYGYGGHDHLNHPYGIAHSQMLAYDPGQRLNPHMYDIRHSQSIGEMPHPVPPKENLIPNHHSGAGDYGYAGGVVGYSYPPQYGMQQDIGGSKDVKETYHNEIEPYSEMYEEGYRKGLHSETGHLLSEDMNNFFDSKFEDGESSSEAGYNDGHSFDKYKNSEDSSNHAHEAGDHDGYNNYHDGADSYFSTVMDAR